MRVLIAEDELGSRLMLTAQLERLGYGVTAVADGAEAWRVLAEPESPRLAILDWSMPEVDGPDVCQRVRALAGQRYTYLVLLTSRSRHGDAVVGLDAGADDFLTKPVDPEELRARLRVGVRILALEERLSQQQAAMETLALTDHTTGLLNRRGGDNAIAREVARARRTGVPLSFAVLDLDHFKRVNDAYGHAIGDQVLREVSLLVSRAVRETDVVARWGGEELLIALPGASLEHAPRVVDRIREMIENLRLDGLPPITASGGVDELQPGEATAELAIRRADAKLYQAKAAGRNRVI